MNKEKMIKLGSENKKVFETNFDEIYDYYHQKAKDDGYLGSLRFIKERSRIVIYVDLKEGDKV